MAGNDVATKWDASGDGELDQVPRGGWAGYGTPPRLPADRSAANAWERLPADRSAGLLFAAAPAARTSDGEGSGGGGGTGARRMSW